MPTTVSGQPVAVTPGPGPHGSGQDHAAVNAGGSANRCSEIEQRHRRFPAEVTLIALNPPMFYIFPAWGAVIRINCAIRSISTFWRMIGYCRATNRTFSVSPPLSCCGVRSRSMPHPLHHTRSSPLSGTRSCSSRPATTRNTTGGRSAVPCRPDHRILPRPGPSWPVAILVSCTLRTDLPICAVTRLRTVLVVPSSSAL